MPINRTTDTPPYIDYITGNVLIPKDNPIPSTIKPLIKASTNFIDIPSYQRGISWNVDKMEEMLDHQSVLLGNIILGQFPLNNQFENLDDEVGHYCYLVDGLQRLSVGTALLAELDPLVLTQNDPKYAAVQGYFNRLSGQYRQLAPIYQFNDETLKNYHRQAISEAYKKFAKRVNIYLEDQFTNGNGAELAGKLETLFLDRQVAVDVYINFPSPIALTYTFIGLNTIRNDLTNTDLVRSFIVERAITQNWPSDDVAEIENYFTEVFTDKEKPLSELQPFIAIVLHFLIKDGPDTDRCLFPNWTSRLSKNEVKAFIRFVEIMQDATHCVIQEIKECGAIPYAVILSHFYQLFMNNSLSLDDIIKIAGEDDGQFDQDLLKLLRAVYRVLFVGQIGRTRKYAEKRFNHAYDRLDDLSDKLSNEYAHKGIDEDLGEEWIKTNLKNADKNRSKRIFNAMRLLEKSTSSNALPSFDSYGQRGGEYHIDHLYPASEINRNKQGFNEGNTLLNFAPLPARDNVRARSTPCSGKLMKSSVYDNYVQSDSSPHPYCEWLVSSFIGIVSSECDKQENLDLAASSSISKARLAWIAEHLNQRL